MASLSDKLKAASANSENSEAGISTMSLDDSIAAYSADDSFERVQNSLYLWIPEYEDTNYSYVDSLKNVSVNDQQINLTQEENSQAIPFELDRYYDGIDLSQMTFQIYYVNAEGKEGLSTPINVVRNSKKIRFYWLVDAGATSREGTLNFEIRAEGSVSYTSNGQTLAKSYKWKTRPNSEINIYKSLTGNGAIEPSIGWDTYLQQVSNLVSEASDSATSARRSAENAQAALNELDTKIDNASTGIADQTYTKVMEAMRTELLKYYTKTEVDNLLKNVDASIKSLQTQLDNMDGLANFKVEYDGTTMKFYNGSTVMNAIAINSDPSAEWETAYDSKVNTMISTALSPVNSDLKNIHSAIDDLPETLKSDYYTKTQTDSKLADKADSLTVANLSATVSKIESTTDSNSSDISTLGTALGDLQTVVDGIDKSPRKTYDFAYNDPADPDVGENQFVVYEMENEGTADEQKTIKQKFTITGGSGGGGGSTVIKIDRITASPLVIISGDSAVIEYNYSSVDASGDDTGEGTASWKVGNTIVYTGIARQGYNSFDCTKYVTTGTQRVTLTVTDPTGSLTTKYWTVQVVDVRLETSFNDTYTYPIGTISFPYTPYGSVAKTVHFILDGKKLGTVTTSASGVPMAYTLPSQSHGAHLLETYITAEVNGETIETEHIFKDILWYDETKTAPVIGCTAQNITALQYDSTNIVYTVYDPSTESPTVILSVDGEVVSTLKLDSATNTWQYKSGEVGLHTLTIKCGTTVKTIKITVKELDIDISPVTANLVFDFNPSGYSNNDADRLWSDGDVAMTVSDNFDWINGGYQLDENGDQYFCIKAGTSALINYKLFEDDAKKNGKEFKLIFKTTNVRKSNASFLSCLDSSIGIQMNVHEAYVYAKADSLYLPYSEEDIIEFEFNINPNTSDIPMVMGYEDGVATRPLIYSDSHDFTQTNPQFISIGCDDCDVYIYRFKVYNAALTDTGILNNFIADARSADVMIDRYERNQIYDENQALTPETLAENCPQLRIIKLEAPHFTNNKSDKVTGTTIQYIYKDGDPILDNWTAYNCQHSGQGTTSNEYGAAGRNLDLIMNKSGVDGVSPRIELSDGTEVKKVSLTRDSVEANYFNVKVNIASSENANNALLQRRYNEYNPYLRPARVADPKVKDTMEFHNCVVFIKESDPDVTTHREFQDTDWHFYGIGNIGDSKKTDNTRLNDPDDPLECIIEIMDNTLPNSTFPGGADALANLEKDPFDESMTYGWRYSYDDSDPAVTGPCIEAWKTFYKFVVNSTDAEFKANLNKYFVVDSALYFYLFTTRYTMTDSRAKNTFYHYGKCEDGVYRFDLCFDYDNDGDFCRCKTFSDIRTKIQGWTTPSNHIFKKTNLMGEQRLNEKDLTA